MRKNHWPARILIAVFVIISLFPIVFIFANSLMSPDEIVNRYTSYVTESNAEDYIVNNVHYVRFGLIPDEPTLEQYTTLLTDSPTYLRMFWNSVLLVVPVLLGQCVIAPLAAYGFERMRWKYKEVLYFMYIIVMLMPTQILLVPNFIVAEWLHIRESYWAIILPAMFHPLGVFLIRQQLKNFPKECLEAAALDGATPWQTYRHIVRPNLRSVVAALVVLLFADNWNIVDQAVVFIHETFESPLSVYLGAVVSSSPGIFFAVSVFYMMPALLVFLFGQDHLTDGISMSTIRS